ncbi:MAG: hypothetical protein KQ78_01486 [Candidatus Izimaplasma bacterium HR2]|nr:MAG: hypothetical protein KQ78_01486 [Candidatus Izimaplasma bacterium HR2]
MSKKVIVDIICLDCKIIKEDVRLAYKEEPTEMCPKCGKQMTKKVAFGSFELKYDCKRDCCDWFGETSQYWKAYKEAKARGENVKPAGED